MKRYFNIFYSQSKLDVYYISTYKILFPVVEPPGKSDSIFCSTASVSVHRTRSVLPI